jgi:hypothetical protein
MVKRSIPIYHKVINELDDNGQLKNQITLDVDKWNNSHFPGYRAGTPIKEGLRCQIKILKIDGVNTRETYIRFDANNQELKLALSDMYLIVEEFMLKEGLKT